MSFAILTTVGIAGLATAVYLEGAIPGTFPHREREAETLLPLVRAFEVLERRYDAATQDPSASSFTVQSYRADITWYLRSHAPTLDRLRGFEDALKGPDADRVRRMYAFYDL